MSPLVSAVSVGEPAFASGVGPASERRRRERFLRDLVVDHEVVPDGVEEATMFGVLATLVRATGRNPRPRRLDLRIAAAAAARIPLLTCDVDDFVGADRLVEAVPVAAPTT